MHPLTAIFAGLGGPLAIAEISARCVFWLRHATPFRIRRIGEYPYRRFIEPADAPLGYRMTSGFASPQFHTNRFGLRGRQPAPDGKKRRIWVFGESDLFGAKLFRESDLWQFPLQRRLERRPGAPWEVINASVIGYNSAQNRALVESLPIGRGDFVLLRPNLNDVSLCRMLGAAWKPGAGWDLEFVYQLERRPSVIERISMYSCLLSMVRRRLQAGKQQVVFGRSDGVFQWESCRRYIFDNLTAMVEHVRAKGATAMLMGWIPAYDPEMRELDQRKIGSLQANWKFFHDTWARHQYALFDEAKDRFAPANDLAYVDFLNAFRGHPDRYRLHLDILHLNAAGHRLAADVLFAALDRHLPSAG